MLSTVRVYAQHGNIKAKSLPHNATDLYRLNNQIMDNPHVERIRVRFLRGHSFRAGRKNRNVVGSRRLILLTLCLITVATLFVEATATGQSVDPNVETPSCDSATRTTFHWMTHPDGTTPEGRVSGSSGLYLVHSFGYNHPSSPDDTPSITVKTLACWDPALNLPTNPLTDHHVTRGFEVAFHQPMFAHSRTPVEVLSSPGASNLSPKPIIWLPGFWLKDPNWQYPTSGERFAIYSLPVVPLRWDNATMPTILYTISPGQAGPRTVALDGSIYSLVADEDLTLWIRFGDAPAGATIAENGISTFDGAISLTINRVANADGYTIGTVGPLGNLNPGIDIPQTTAENPTYTFTGLSPSTEYQLYVRTWYYQNGVSFSEPTRLVTAAYRFSATTTAEGEGSAIVGPGDPAVTVQIDTRDFATYRQIEDLTAGRVTEPAIEYLEPIRVLDNQQEMRLAWSTVEGARSYTVRSHRGAPLETVTSDTFSEVSHAKSSYYAGTFGWATSSLFPRDHLNRLLFPTDEQFPRITLVDGGEKQYLKAIWINAIERTVTMIIAGDHAMLFRSDLAPIFTLVYHTTHPHGEQRTWIIELDPVDAIKSVTGSVPSGDVLGPSRFSGQHTEVTWLAPEGGFHSAEPGELGAVIMPQWQLETFHVSSFETDSTHATTRVPLGTWIQYRVRTNAVNAADNSTWSGTAGYVVPPDGAMEPVSTQTAVPVAPNPMENTEVHDVTKGIVTVDADSSLAANMRATVASIIISVGVGGAVFVVAKLKRAAEMPVFLPILLTIITWMACAIVLAHLNLIWVLGPPIFLLAAGVAVALKVRRRT